VERALSAVYVYPYRCGQCARRFRALQWGTRYVRVDPRDNERVVVRLPAIMVSRDGQAAAEVTDLSLTGCGVKAELHPLVGEQVTLSIQLAPAARPVDLPAVVHSVHTGAVGLEFAGIGDTERQHLREFLVRRVGTAASREPPAWVTWMAAPRPTSTAVGLIMVVVLLSAFLVMRFWSAFRVCAWGQTC
jgi:hypothetical protein